MVHDEVRKVVTVVTSDLKGSTSLGERLDPESLREVLTRYFDEMRAVLEARGGVIEKIIGDAIVAVFGLPDAAPGHELRAVAAAAETQRALTALNEQLDVEWGVTLTTRTGVATGRVVVGEALAGQHVLMGPAMELATAMEQNAPAMEVLVHSSTRDLIPDYIDVEAVDPFVPKGFTDPVVAYRLVAVRKAGFAALKKAGIDGLLCPDCGARNPARATSCGTCGATLSSVAIAQESRKTVSIVFADPKPGTVTTEPASPEALGDVMTRYFEAMRTILERHGGTVEKFIGDAVMAVFGMPVRHEDDALRATRAALDMQAAMPALNEGFVATYGITLRSHIGVNTGEVVVGDASLGQRLVTGDAVNVAARLEQSAGSLEVLIGDLTYRLVRDTVDVEAVEPLHLKGKSEPVPAYRLVSIRTLRDAGRRQDAPMVGRVEESAILSRALSDSITLQRPRLVTVIGDAGVGKTRLTSEFLESVSAQAAVYKGRCLPYGDGITFWPIAEVVREAAGIQGEDAPEEAIERLNATAGGDDDVVDRLASILGLSTSSYQVGELFWAIRRFFEILAADAPLVLLIDDIHWAEATLLDLFEDLMASATDSAVLVLCTARHELLESYPEHAQGEGADRIILKPLSEADSAQVVDALLGEAGINDAVRARIVEASEGNPLFVEQLLAMLIDGDRLRRTDDGWVATSDLADLSIPPTIHALLAARLDALPTDERRVAGTASVIGLAFPQQALEALTPDQMQLDVERHLGTLSSRQVVRPQPDAPADDPIFRFHHLLIRDAAYQGLLKRSRADLHERFVAWADPVNAERGRAIEFEEILGYHLEQAHRYRSELGPQDSRAVDLGQRAAERLGSAGSRAIARGDMPAAANLLGRAAALLASDHPDRPWLLIRTGEAQFELGDFADAADRFDAAVESAEAGDQRAVAATARIERLRLRYLTDAAGNETNVAAHVRDTLPLLEAAGEEMGMARAWRLLTYIEIAGAQWGAAEQAATAMLDHARESGDRLMEIRGLPALAGIARYGPLPVDDALVQCEALLERAEGDRRAEALIERAIAHLHAMRGDADTARSIYRRVRTTLVELGWRFDAALVSIDSGPIEMLAGDPAAAERELRSDLRTLEHMAERNYITTTAAYLAEALYRLGRYQESDEQAVFSAQTAAPDDLLTQFLWRGVGAKLLARTGRHDEAEVIGREAVRLAETSDDPIAQANAQVDLAEVMALGGQPADAEALLEAAVERYRRKGSAASVVISEARLATLLR